MGRRHLGWPRRPLPRSWRCRGGVSMDPMKHMHDIVPFRIGSRVRVRPENKYASDWPDVCVVTGMRWEYQRGNGRVNIEIATDDDIKHGYGATDGWRADDLMTAAALAHTPQPGKAPRREIGGQYG